MPRPANFFPLTMLRQHSQYDSRLGFSFRVLVRVRLTLILTPTLKSTLTQNLTLTQTLTLTLSLTITLTKTLKLNPNLLSYWECCRNMVRKKDLRPAHRADLPRHGAHPPKLMLLWDIANTVVILSGKKIENSSTHDFALHISASYKPRQPCLAILIDILEAVN